MNGETFLTVARIQTRDRVARTVVTILTELHLVGVTVCVSFENVTGSTVLSVCVCVILVLGCSPEGRTRTELERSGWEQKLA